MAGVIDNDLGWDKIMRELKGLEGIDVTVGIHEGESQGGELAVAAAANEFGTDEIPERPTFRPTFDANRDKYEATIKAGLARGASGRAVVHAAGIEVRNDLIRARVELSSPPNAASTIARKGSANPLVDSGLTAKAIRAKVGRNQGGSP